MSTIVPTIHVEEGPEVWVGCPWCMKTVLPAREVLSEYRDLRYESAACPHCRKQIAGLVITLKHNRRATDKER